MIETGINAMLTWVFFGRTDAKAETPVLWPPHAKSWLIGKDSEAGRDWGQEEKGMTEDEMAGSQRVRHDWATELNRTECHRGLLHIFIGQKCQNWSVFCEGKSDTEKTNTQEEKNLSFSLYSEDSLLVLRGEGVDSGQNERKE